MHFDSKIFLSIIFGTLEGESPKGFFSAQNLK